MLSPTYHMQSDSHAFFAGNSSQRSGWHLYREALVRSGIKQNVQQWYARHAKRFIRKITPDDLNSLTRSDIENHFDSIPTDWFRHDWQHIQYIDAIRILLVNVLQLPWAADFPWGDYIASARTLSIQHPTIAREAHNETPIEPEFSNELSPEYLDSLQALSRSLRENQYAIRTEQTYCHWVMTSMTNINP